MRRRQPYRRKRVLPRFLSLLLLLLLLGGSVFNYLRPLPVVTVAGAPVVSQIDSTNLRWPAGGVAAIGAQGYGMLAKRGGQAPRPTASLAKLVTALAVLEKKPLNKGQQGSVFTYTEADRALFEKYYAVGGAVTKVEVGAKITEYQALQGVLLPSSNNLADSLAVWTFGSMEAYHQYANAMLKRLGLENTTVAADASGMSPASKSTLGDIIRLGELSMNHPVIAEIVSQKSAEIPVHGTIYSANSRLGFNNIIGIKTGLTDEAGGCFLFAAKHEVAPGRQITIIGAIMGAPTLLAAMQDSEGLLNSAKPYFAVKTPIKMGETLTTITPSWPGAQPVTVVAKQDVSIVAWKGAAVTPRIDITPINHDLPAGSEVGTVTVASGTHTVTAPLTIKESLPAPNLWWRIFRV